jgi:flagellar protein FlaC
LGKEETFESTEETNSDTPQATAEAKTTVEPAQENKQEVDSIRTVIKVNEEESPVQNTAEKSDADVPPKASQPAAVPFSGSKDEAKQTRDILQSMKDFDYKIMKNQEEIGKLFEKLDGLSNDLDDLVSLYEIVSEQMNPFVGLSKVTKKRIDTLENFTPEIDSLKTRIGDLESILEKTATSTGETVDNSFSPSVIQNIGEPLSDEDVDYIVNSSFEVLFTEQNIDNMINEFLLSLK